MRIKNMPGQCPFKVGDKVAYRESYGGIVLHIVENEDEWLLYCDDDIGYPWSVAKGDPDRSGMRFWKGDVP